MSYVGKVTAGGSTHLVGSTLYGTCTTAAGTAAKVVTCANFDQLIEGVTIHVKFTYANSVANPTLNVNSTGAKNIYRYGTTAPSTSAATSWRAGSVVSFTYDGSYWQMNGWLNDNTTYTAASANPVMDGTAAVGTSAKYAREDHVHPSDTSRVPTSRTVNGHALSADISITASDVSAIPTSQKGAANGVAELDANGKVPTSQLPEGQAQLVLGETSDTAYRGDRGKAAYDHAVTNKGSAFTSGLYLIETNAEGHVIGATAVTKADITALGIPGSDTNTTYTASTESIGSASGWSAGSIPTLGTAISADEITSWSAGTAASASAQKGIVTFTNGAAPNLQYTAKSIPNVTSAGTAPSLTITSKTVVTGITED